MISKSKKAFFVWKKNPPPFSESPSGPIYAVQEKERIAKIDDGKSRTRSRKLFFGRAHGKTIHDLSSRTVVAAGEYRSRIQKPNKLQDQVGEAFMQSGNRRLREVTWRRRDKVGKSKRWQYMQVNRSSEVERHLAHDCLSRVAVRHGVGSVVVLVSTGLASAVGAMHGIVPGVSLPTRLVVV